MTHVGQQRAADSLSVEPWPPSADSVLEICPDIL